MAPPCAASARSRRRTQRPQWPALPTGRGQPSALPEQVGHQPHPPEVDLDLLPGLAGGDADRALSAPVVELSSAEAVQRPVGHAHPAATQQDLDLDQRQTGLDALLQKLPLGLQLGPALAARPARAQRQHHRPDQLVRELRLSCVAPYARRHPSRGVARRDLAIQA